MSFLVLKLFYLNVAKSIIYLHYGCQLLFLLLVQNYPFQTVFNPVEIQQWSNHFLHVMNRFFQYCFLLNSLSFQYTGSISVFFILFPWSLCLLFHKYHVVSSNFCRVSPCLCSSFSKWTVIQVHFVLLYEL